MAEWFFRIQRRLVPAPRFELESRDPQSLRISGLPYAGI